MLKVTASQMKVSPKPSKATVQAMPAGHAEHVRKGAEADARAREYKAGAAERRAEVMAGLRAFNIARYAATKDAREAAKAAKREAARNKPVRLWDNFEEIAVIQKSSTLRFHISACTRNGFRCVTVREFYKRRSDGLWLPGRSGISIPLMMPLNRTKTPDPNTPIKIIYPMQEFILALQQAIDTAANMDLADPDNAVWLRYQNKTEDNNNENS